MKTVAPPRRSSLLPLVFAAVLSLTLAGFAHAFTVQIVQPADDPWLMATDSPQTFEAVAYDGEQDITSEVTWSWNFDDGSGADTDNPTEHAYETADSYTVTVTATWSAQQAQDQIDAEAQEPTGAFVLARKTGANTYVTMEGDDICHTRYLLAFDEFERWYDGVRFQSKYSWVQEFGAGTFVYPSQEITLDGDQYDEAWVLEWHTDEAAGQATAGTFNADVNWRITGQYLDWEMEPQDEIVGEPTYTVGNTVVSSSGGVLFYDPDDEEMDECVISWTTTHTAADASIEFRVPIAIYDLTGTLLYEHVEEHVGLGTDSWPWNGTIIPQEPEGPTQATKGIYTYTVGVVGEIGYGGGVKCSCPTLTEGCARGDWDKSAFLTISNVSVSDFEWSETNYPDEASVVLHYTLSCAADSVDVQCYKPDLSVTAIEDPETFPASSGAHNVEVTFQVDRALMGPYRFVLSAGEAAAEAAHNRDRSAKPALQAGATQVIWPPASGVLGGAIAQSPWTLSQVVALMGAEDVDGTHYAATGDASGTALAARNALRAGGIVFLHAHSNAGRMSFDNGQGSGVSDLIGGSGTDNANDDNYYVENIPEDLDHVLFALCAGCESAGSGSWSSSSVPGEIIAKGGQSAMGFLTEILSPQTWTFAHEFFDVTTSHISVDTAAAVALDEVWDVHGTYGGMDNWCRGGSNVEIRPARFGE